MKDYWKNRKAGKRGQGEQPVLEKVNPELSKPASYRKRLRQKVRDGIYTKKLFFGHIVNDYRYQVEKPDPNKNNKQRLKERGATKSLHTRGQE